MNLLPSTILSFRASRMHVPRRPARAPRCRSRTGSARAAPRAATGTTRPCTAPRSRTTSARWSGHRGRGEGLRRLWEKTEEGSKEVEGASKVKRETARGMRWEPSISHARFDSVIDSVCVRIVLATTMIDECKQCVCMCGNEVPAPVAVDASSGPLLPPLPLSSSSHADRKSQFSSSRSNASLVHAARTAQQDAPTTEQNENVHQDQPSRGLKFQGDARAPEFQLPASSPIR